MTPPDASRQPLQGSTRLLVIQTLAGFAQWIDIFLIFAIPAFLWNSSPAELSILASCFALPSLIVGPLIGVALDQTAPSRAMLCGALAACALSVLIAFSQSFFLFAVLVCFKGLANTLYWPASAIVTNVVINESERMRYFSSLSALDQATKIGTPLLAGVLTMVVPMQSMFLISAAAMLMVCTLSMRLEVVKPTSFTKTSRTTWGLVAALMVGFRSLGTLAPLLRLSIVLGIGISLTLAVYDPHLSAFLASWKFDLITYSMLLSSTGAGAVAGALFVRFALGNVRPTLLVRFGVLVFSLSILAAAMVMVLAPELLTHRLLIGLWFANGLGYELFSVGSMVIIQNLCPPALLGRISTSVRSLKLIAMVLGPSIGAWLIVEYSRTGPFVAAAGLGVVLTLMALSYEKFGSWRLAGSSTHRLPPER